MKSMKNLYEELFNQDGAKFIGAQRSCKNCQIGIVGVPYDGTTSFKPGARFGPSAIKEFSHAIETYCPQLKTDINEFNYADLGSLNIPFGDPYPVIKYVKKAINFLLKENIVPLIIGGEHSISIGSIHAIAEKYPELILVQLDAHADLRQEWLGNKYSHACTMTRSLELLPSKTLFQVGIRSGTCEEFEEIRKNNSLINETNISIANNLEYALRPFLGKPIYITLDLDWFDPSIVPGTGTPEPGGHSWKDFSSIIEIIKKHNIVAADIVELSPQLDASGISSILAAKAARSLLILLQLSKLNYKNKIHVSVP